MAVLDALVRGAQREVRNIRNFATTTMGPFETVDAVVRDARKTVRDIGSELGVKAPMFGRRAPMFSRRFRRY